MEDVEQQFAGFRERFVELEAEIQRIFIGQPKLVERLLVCLLSRGHVLIEGLPGLGKTLLVRTLSEALDLSFSRVQCTPDLMPADIIGTNMLVEDERGNQHVRFHRGPIFANVVLADEVNRATPKTQSAFLEAMQEKRVTALGSTFELEEPFLLLATQNPIEMEGTYPLPEAQLDRFLFKLEVAFPDLDELSRIVDQTTGEEPPAVRVVCGREEILAMSTLARRVKVGDRVKRYALRLVLASHAAADEAPPAVREYVKHGASPRAAQSMILGGKVLAAARGRYHVAVEDLRELALPSLVHRIILGFEGEMAGIAAADVVRELVRHVEP